MRRRWLAAAAWAGGAIALFAFLYQISLAWPVDSDGANSALQSWDMLHGHLLLHGWILGDAAFSTFEVPLGAVTEALFGLSAVAAHLVSVLAYLIVAILAVLPGRLGQPRRGQGGSRRGGDRGACRGAHPVGRLDPA